MAGLIATVLGVPMLGVGFIAALFLQRVALQRFVGHDVEWSDLHEGGMALLANVVLAVLIGFIAAAGAGYITLALMKRAATRAFTIVAGIGALALALGVYRLLLHKAEGDTFDLVMLVGFGWLAALAGFYGAAALRDDPNEIKRTAAQGDMDDLIET